MGARLSVRLALILSVALAAGAGALFLLLTQRISNHAWAEAETSLRAEVLLLQDALGAELENADASELQTRTQTFGQSMGIRITLIRPDGTVVADSDSNPARMDNLASRPEVIAALTQEFATCHRMSPTLGVDALFVARAIRRGDRFAGWIRTSVTAERVTAGLDGLEWIMIAVVAVATLAAFLIGALWMNFTVARRSAAAD